MCRSNLMATQRDNGRETEIKRDKVREREKVSIPAVAAHGKPPRLQEDKGAPIAL